LLIAGCKKEFDVADIQQLDRTYHFIMESFVQRGQAPHYTEIAQAFSASPDEGKQLLLELMSAKLAAWLHPGTDLIASFAPFNNLPTQYRITIDGQQKWFAQCGLESLAICWLFPGQEIQIETTCLDCGESIGFGIRDGVIQGQVPSGIYGYVDIPFRDWSQNWPYT
jgi:hypothetical protein